jgi:CheY-like chemotaxis protein/anti-sigma regulatory factor (Ser/Thr protein kinase)
VHKNLTHVPSVLANEARLGQVFVNLLTNAADAMPSRPVAQNVITVTTRLRNGEVSVEVQDNGGGIAPEVLPRIFDPFFSTKPHGKGSGLGLSICRSVVEQLRGRIEVESTLGVGSTFRVLLPAAPARAPRLRILVIDDDLLMCRTLQRLLGARHHVEHHQSAMEALSRPDLDEFDVILCDLMMPELNGSDFYERVRATLPQVAPRIGFMTGGPANRKLLRAEAMGRVLDKPLQGDKLEALLATLSGRTGRA